jgi:hypothetical protein
MSTTSNEKRRDMKMSTALLCLSLFVAVDYVHAQQFPTNNVSQEQAVRIASRLRVGMSEGDVAQVVDQQNGLKSGGDIGGSLGWSRFYLLSNGCFLDLKMKPKEIRSDGIWPSNGLLQSASIQSNVVKIVSIALTNANAP